MGSHVRGARALLLRERLVERVVGGRVMLVQAGGGFGKSVLVAQVADRVPGSTCVSLPRREQVDLDLLQALVGDGRRGLLLVDNVTSLTHQAAAWLADLAAESPDLQVIVSGRAMPSDLAALEVAGVAGRVVSDDLRLTPAESRDLVGLRLGETDGRRLWSALYDFSGGWVALLSLVLRRIELAADRRVATTDLLRRPALIGELISHYLAGLSDTDRGLFDQLARLPMVNDTVADALGGPGLLPRVRRAGIPLDLGPDGWWRLPPIVKEHVTAGAAPDRALTRRIAPVYEDAGAELTAAELLVECGELREAAACLARLPAARIDAQDAQAVIRLVERLGPAAHAEPRTLLHLARVYGNLAMLSEERATIDQALAAVEAGNADDGLAVEIEAESLFLRSFALSARLTGPIESLLERTASCSPARARLLDALAVALSNDPSEPALRRAENAARQAAMLWLDLGEPARAASSQRGLAVRILPLLGKHDAAAQLFQRQQETVDTQYERLLCLVFGARALALGGRGERVEPVADEALSLGELLEVPWVVGYIAWIRMLVAANEGRADEVAFQLALAEATLGELAEDVGAVQFLCEAADACARIGRHAEAREILVRAQARRDEDASLVDFTAACCAIRRGEAEAADTLARLAKDDVVPPGLRWKAELLLGLAARRAGDLEAARDRLQATLDHAARVGQPDLADRREPQAIEALRAVAASTHPEPARVAAAPVRYEVTLLGRFEVRRDGEVVAAPPGRPTRLIKGIGLSGGRLSVEAVIESLWPEEMAGVGRRRLRNVLLRCRAAVGPLVERRGDHLELADCTIDLASFEEAVRQVALRRGDDRVAHAREALARYSGRLLPEDLYDDMIDHHREAVRLNVLRLTDVVLTADLAAGAIDDALTVLQVAWANDPGDQERALRVARVLRDAGRDLEAISLAHQARAGAENLGLPPAAEWSELALPTRRH